MKNYYSDIAGWFDYAEFYDCMIGLFDNAVFVEIGVWKGKSIMYMAQKIKESGKTIKLYGIDTFEGLPVDSMPPGKNEIKSSLFQIYLHNIKPLNNYISTIKGNSHEVHEMFADKSIDFLYIDGDHSYQGIKKDIELWYPKVKPGGIIAGHDFIDDYNMGVVQAVKEFFTEYFLWDLQLNKVWYHKKALI